VDEDERRWLFEAPPHDDDAEPVALASRDEWADEEDERDEIVESVSESPADE
jgi:hypothetical protein